MKHAVGERRALADVSVHRCGFAWQLASPLVGLTDECDQDARPPSLAAACDARHGARHDAGAAAEVMTDGSHLDGSTP